MKLIESVLDALPTTAPEAPVGTTPFKNEDSMRWIFKMFRGIYGVRWDNYIGDKKVELLRLWGKTLSRFNHKEYLGAFLLIRDNPKYHEYSPNPLQFYQLCVDAKKAAKPSDTAPRLENKTQFVPPCTLAVAAARLDKMSLAEKLEYLPEDLHHHYVDTNGQEIRRE